MTPWQSQRSNVKLHGRLSIWPFCPLVALVVDGLFIQQSVQLYVLSPVVGAGITRFSSSVHVCSGMLIIFSTKTKTTHLLHLTSWMLSVITRVISAQLPGVAIQKTPLDSECALNFGGNFSFNLEATGTWRYIIKIYILYLLGIEGIYIYIFIMRQIYNVRCLC